MSWSPSQLLSMLLELKITLQCKLKLTILSECIRLVAHYLYCIWMPRAGLRPNCAWCCSAGTAYFQALAHVHVHKFSHPSSVHSHSYSPKKCTSNHTAGIFYIKNWKKYIRLSSNLASVSVYYYCAAVPVLHYRFSSLCNRELFDHVSKVKAAAQQLMLNARKCQHA